LYVFIFSAFCLFFIYKVYLAALVLGLPLVIRTAMFLIVGLVPKNSPVALSPSRFELPVLNLPQSVSGILDKVHPVEGTSE